MPFVPTGYLKHSEAIDRVAEIINGRDPVPPLTEEERNVLQALRDRIKRAKRPTPREVTPIHSLSTYKPFVSGRACKFVEAEPPPPLPKISREEFKNLEAKEARIKEQHHVAGQVLRQLLYAGRVTSQTINENGSCIKTPKRIWSGKQWDEALRANRVVFVDAYGLSVSGRPIILLDALEAAFNPDGTVKERPRLVVSKSTAEGVELQLAPPSPAPVSKAGTTVPTDDATARDDQLQQSPELSEPADPKSSAVHPDHRGRKPGAGQKSWTQPRLDYWKKRKTEILREPERSHFSLLLVAKKIVKEDAPDHLSDDDKVAWKRKGWTTANILRGIKGRRQSPTSTKKMGQLPPR